jgi:hypothetical protein
VPMLHEPLVAPPQLTQRRAAAGALIPAGADARVGCAPGEVLHGLQHQWRAGAGVRDRPRAPHRNRAGRGPTGEPPPAGRSTSRYASILSVPKGRHLAPDHGVPGSAVGLHSGRMIGFTVLRMERPSPRADMCCSSGISITSILGDALRPTHVPEASPAPWLARKRCGSAAIAWGTGGLAAPA